MRTQHLSGGHPERLVYERALPAVPLAVGRMRHELDAALQRLGVPRVRRHDVSLVLTEAAANVVVHAYADASPGLLYTLASISGANLLLDVFDRGRGMVPNAQSPGLGVGLALMAQLTDGLDIAPNGGGGLQVMAVFRGVSAAEAPDPAESSRAERLREYADALADARTALREDRRVLMAEAEAAIAHAQALRAERLG
jgi:anti-sigma regulatory factor (Ser/Thr protein kinase)